MARDEVEAELHRLLELAGVDPEVVEPDTPIEELLLDSLDYAEIRAALRSRFGVDISPEELRGAATVGEAAEVITSKVVSRQR